MELAEKVRDLSSDLVEAVRALTGEQAEMGGGDASPAGGVGSPAGGPMAADDQEARKKKDSSKESSASDNFSTATLNTLRRELNGALTHAIKEAVAELNEHQQELEMISGMYDKGAVNSANQEFVSTIVEDALNETKSAMADGFKLMQAFVKYARGTKAIVKRAEIEAELQSLAEEDSSMSNERDSHSADGGDLMGLINDTNADLDAVHEMMGDDGLGEEDHEHEGGEGGGDGLGLEGLLEGLAADDNDVVQVENAAQAGEVLKTNPDASVMVGKQASYDSRQGRAWLRAKLAADATGKEENGEIQSAEKIQFSDMLDQADKLTDGQTHLDTKPSSNTGEAKFPLGLVETNEESLKAMLEVARMPPKVRKEAEAIQRLVSEGKLDPRDVDALVAEGLDKDAVAYWKKFYGEVDGGSEFASELVKEHVKASMEEELNKFRVKMARSFETAYDMVDRGMCRNDRVAISAQVDELMKFSDDNFESLKRVIARHEPVLSKRASRVPQVGLRDDSEFVSQASALTAEDEYAQLSSMFGTKKGVF
jgi:hypothetical protein